MKPKTILQTMEKPSPTKGIEFTGIMADGSKAPSLKAWLDERRRLGLPTDGPIQCVGVNPSACRLASGTVALG